MIPEAGEESYNPAVDYDAQTFRLIVNVTDNGKGKLDIAQTGLHQADGTLTDGIAFSNHYHADGTLTFEGEKQVNGSTATAQSLALQPHLRQRTERELILHLKSSPIP